MNIKSELTNKDDQYSCGLTDKIIADSETSNQWYCYFDDIAELLDYSKSIVRNRVLYILAALAKWDDENHFDDILDKYLSHIEDDKPITSRQCIKALKILGKAKPQYCNIIVVTLNNADISKYKDSMRPLIEKDIQETINSLNN